MVIEKEDDIKDLLNEKGTVVDTEIQEMVKDILKAAKQPLNEDILWVAILLLDRLRTDESLLRLVMDGTMKAKFKSEHESDEVVSIDDYWFYCAEQEEFLRENKPEFNKLFEKEAKEKQS